MKKKAATLLMTSFLLVGCQKNLESESKKAQENFQDAITAINEIQAAEDQLSEDFKKRYRS